MMTRDIPISGNLHMVKYDVYTRRFNLKPTMATPATTKTLGKPRLVQFHHLMYPLLWLLVAANNAYIYSTYIHKYVCTKICIYIYVCMYVCMNVYIHIHIYTYTFIHHLNQKLTYLHFPKYA